MTVLGAIVLWTAMQFLVVGYYCSPPVVFTWSEGCVPIKPLETEKE